VVSVPMLADEGTPVNTDADRAAAAIAGALGASLVVLTDVAGVYEDPEDETTLIEAVDSPETMAAAEDAAEGFMSKKVLAAREALAGGAEEVVVADANQRDPVVRALGGSAGTRFGPGAL
jgi:acetylglutamate/LysW-gamma-L-alpha-aminoadipate kinase